MADHHDASPHKRKRAPIEDLQSQSKKPKLSPPPRPPPPVVRLTRNAIRQLNRRNKEAARSARNSKPKRPGSPVPRHAAADLPACSASDLERFARHGGPDLSDLRGCHPPAVRPPMSSRVSLLRRGTRRSARFKSRTATSTVEGTAEGTPMPTSTSSARFGPYDKSFGQHLIKFNVYPDGHEDFDGQSLPEPDNLDEIRRALTQEPRRSLSPSRSLRTEFQRFRRADASAKTERMVTQHVVPIIQGDIGDYNCMGIEILFNNLDHLTDGSIGNANPDYYYGARLQQLDERVFTELGGIIIPSTQLDQPILPNFFFEVKGPSGFLGVAKRQACYDGALGARGMQHLLSYGSSDLVYDNKAYTLTCTYYGGQLDMYTTHVMPPARPGGRSRYVMTLVSSYSLKGGPDMFRAALTAYRNGRDWAERQRNEAIEQANMRAQVALIGVGIGVGASAPPGDDGATLGHPPPPVDDGATSGHPSPPVDDGATLGHPSPPVDDGATLGHPPPPGGDGATSGHPPTDSNNATSGHPPSNHSDTETSSPPTPGDDDDDGTSSFATNEASGLGGLRRERGASQQDNTPTSPTPLTLEGSKKVASSPKQSSPRFAPGPQAKRRRKGSPTRSRDNDENAASFPDPC